MDPLSTFLQKAGYTTFTRGQGDIRIFLAGFVQVTLSLVAVIFIAIIIYGGYLWLTAGGNEEQVKKARQFVTRAIIGFVITLAAMVITQFIVGFIEGATLEPFGGAPMGESLF